LYEKKKDYTSLERDSKVKIKKGNNRKVQTTEKNHQAEFIQHLLVFVVIKADQNRKESMKDQFTD
jgi:hypothetical protein